MKSLMIAAFLLATGIAQADINWDFDKGNSSPSKILNYQFSDKNLIVQTDTAMYIFMPEVLAEVGLSSKELRDLIKEHENSRSSTLVIRGSRIPGSIVKRITKIIINQK